MTVYIVKIYKKTAIVTVVLASNPHTVPKAFVRSGVASENVVAVAQTTAKWLLHL